MVSDFKETGKVENMEALLFALHCKKLIECRRKIYFKLISGRTLTENEKIMLITGGIDYCFIFNSLS